MNRRTCTGILGTITATALLTGAWGCQSGGGGGKMSGNAGMHPPFGGPDDVRRAERLWSTLLRDYTQWPSYPGKSGWQEGKSPHGKYLRYYINSVAARDPAHPHNGYLIVKENYTAPRRDALVAVTIMQKVRGYDPDDGDWFWVKYSPSGEIMTNPKGMKLAGRVAKGMNKGCIACHGNAGGGDFLFVNDQ